MSSWNYSYSFSVSLTFFRIKNVYIEWKVLFMRHFDSWQWGNGGRRLGVWAQTHTHTPSGPYTHVCRHTHRPMHTDSQARGRSVPHSTHVWGHTHTRTHRHSLTSTPAGTHLCGPELQHQGAGLHLLRHAHLLQVQQVTLQPLAPVGPAGQPGWSQQLPQATFDLAHLVLIPCRDGAQRMGAGYSSTSSPGPSCPALPSEAMCLRVSPQGVVGSSCRGKLQRPRSWNAGLVERRCSASIC